MALELFTGTKSKVQFIPSGSSTVISLDCSVSEKHARESPPTEFEVEDGSTISDHIIVKPFTLDIKGIITDSPLSLVNALISTAATALLPPIGVIGTSAGLALASALSGAKSPSVAAYGQLLELQASRLPFNVLTSLQLYKNMWIKSITVPRESGSANMLSFDISLVQLLLVTPQTVNIVKFADPGLAAPQADLGKQEVESPEAQAFKKNLALGQSISGFKP